MSMDARAREIARCIMQQDVGKKYRPLVDMLTPVLRESEAAAYNQAIEDAAVAVFAKAFGPGEMTEVPQGRDVRSFADGIAAGQTAAAKAVCALKKDPE